MPENPLLSYPQQTPTLAVLPSGVFKIILSYYHLDGLLLAKAAASVLYIAFHVSPGSLVRDIVIRMPGFCQGQLRLSREPCSAGSTH